MASGIKSNQNFKTNLLFLFLEFVQWIAHVWQRKLQENLALFLLTCLRKRVAISSPYLSKCFIRVKKKVHKTPPTIKHNPHWSLWWTSQCRLPLLSPALSAKPAQGAAVGNPVFSAQHRKKGLGPLLCCGLLWQSQKCWQDSLHLNEHLHLCAWIQAPMSTQLSPHNVSNQAMTPAGEKSSFLLQQKYSWCADLLLLVLHWSTN